MYELLATQGLNRVLSPIAQLLGYLMNGIYVGLDRLFNMQNIGMCIIIFTIIIYVCLLPLTIKQQRFTRISQIINPEIKKINEKYKNKKDQASMMAMQDETKAVYEKYGVSPSGSCIQMAIQIPILWSLYRVIYNVPTYVPAIKQTFSGLVDGIMGTNGYQNTLTDFMENVSVRNAALDFDTTATTVNSISDMLYKLNTSGWETLKTTFSGLGDLVTSTQGAVEHFNYFLGINIANSPWFCIQDGWASKDFLLVFAGILVPVVSALTQFLNVKLMPQPASAGAGDAMGQQMKTMNYIMPLFSFFMVFSLPYGVGIYWIAAAVVRTIIQLLINQHLNKIDINLVIEKNKEKAKAKAEKRKAKRGIYENQIRNSATMKTRNIDASKIQTKNTSNDSKPAGTPKPGSMAAKANIVSEFNSKNSKK